MGWLHRPGKNSKYKRVQLQQGGGTRRIEYDERTVENLLENAKSLFFPGGKSQKGDLSNMKSELGNFQHEIIRSFKDREGNEVTLNEYLKSYGLYSSRTYLFLMTTGSEADGHTPSISNEEETDHRNEELREYLRHSDSSSASSSYSENRLLLPSSKDVLVSKKVETITRSMSTSSNVCIPNLEDQIFLPSSVEVDTSWICTNEWINSHSLHVQYVLSSLSLYSDQEVSICSFSRESCYEIATSNDPFLLETPINEFQPPESYFTVTSIAKGTDGKTRQTLCKFDFSSSG